jgi:lysophospholipase L1-like esterase
MTIPIFIVALFLIVGNIASAASSATQFKFEFGDIRSGADIHILSTNLYSESRGYGFERGAKISANNRGCSSESAFLFSIAVLEGNYNVTVTLGDPSTESLTTVKAESRRLMLENIHTAAGQFTSRTFTINVRTPQITPAARVKLKPRELGPPVVPDWDDKLTLEFNGSHPSLCSLEISNVSDAITVFLAGDSTVTDQAREPWNSWGQMLPRFFKTGVAIANHAESGESLPSFLGEKRFEKIISVIKSGDYLFIQFGHNDQKDKRPNAGAFTIYTTNLLYFITETRRHGAIPILVTPMERKAGITNDTLGDFPAAVRQVAKETKVPLIDLHAMNKKLYAGLGTNIDQAFQDGTHHNNYGSYELAKCIIAGIKSNQLPLTKFLADDVRPFDPNHPDSLPDVRIPASPTPDSEKPEGN